MRDKGEGVRDEEEGVRDKGEGVRDERGELRDEDLRKEGLGWIGEGERCGGREYVVRDEAEGVWMSEVGDGYR